MSTVTSKELADSVCHGALTIGGTSMNNKAWASLNNYVLWPGAPRRGENLKVPGRPGRIALPRRKDEADLTLEVLIIGDCGPTGTPFLNRSAGLATNWITLRSAIMDWGGSTISASLVLPNSVTLSGAVQVVDHDFGETGVTGALTLTIDLTLPSGELT